MFATWNLISHSCPHLLPLCLASSTCVVLRYYRDVSAHPSTHSLCLLLQRVVSYSCFGFRRTGVSSASLWPSEEFNGSIMSPGRPHSSGGGSRTSSLLTHFTSATIGVACCWTASSIFVPSGEVTNLPTCIPAWVERYKVVNLKHQLVHILATSFDTEQDIIYSHDPSHLFFHRQIHHNMNSWDLFHNLNFVTCIHQYHRRSVKRSNPSPSSLYVF